MWGQQCYKGPTSILSRKNMLIVTSSKISFHVQLLPLLHHFLLALFPCVENTVHLQLKDFSMSRSWTCLCSSHPLILLFEFHFFFFHSFSLSQTKPNWTWIPGPFLIMLCWSLPQLEQGWFFSFFMIRLRINQFLF